MNQFFHQDHEYFRQTEIIIFIHILSRRLGNLLFKMMFIWKQNCKRMTNKTVDPSSYILETWRKTFALRERCPYSELFWSAAFFSIRTEYGEIFCISPYSVRMHKNPGKMRTRLTLNTDYFYAVLRESYLCSSMVSGESE